MNFKDLGVEDRLVESLSINDIIEPTEIQRLVIPRILRGEELVARSQTGSGKTLAYLLPLIQRLSININERVLILAPTRELAQQIGRVCSNYTTLSIAVIYGGVEYEAQYEALTNLPQVVIATPGRLQDIVDRGVVEIHRFQYFLLDEVDQMVDMGFREPIMELSKLRDESCQSLFFSATLPAGVMDILKELTQEVEVVDCDGQPLAAQKITQTGYYVEQSMMDQLLLHLIRSKSPEKTIIFCRSKKMADRLTQILKGSNFSAEAIHSDRSQAAREHILRRFTEGETSILVATDLMARGIDVDGVTHIFNYGLPQSPEQYIHRVGRTGRAGASGEAISLICPDEKRLLDATCALMRQPIPISTNHPYMTTAVTTMLSGVVLRKKVRK
ncbi:MAG: DEAD/DEAH box helicase [Rikenellaceae bacterium]